jgi:hypothetical protein
MHLAKGVSTNHLFPHSYINARLFAFGEALTSVFEIDMTSAVSLGFNHSDLSFNLQNRSLETRSIISKR